MRGKTTPIDGYLARVGDEQRAALERLRRTIRASAPGAEEIISYGNPTFRLDGRGVVGFGASSKLVKARIAENARRGRR
jgi:uncharacterized protein YdhG (YjbR/CyaY superfamily)